TVLRASKTKYTRSNARCPRIDGARLPPLPIRSPLNWRLTNSFFLKDRCSLFDQISFILASSRRAFILAMRDRDRANKNEIEIFVFSVTSNDFPHDMLLLTLASNSSSQQTESRSLGRVHAMQATVSYRVGH